MKKKIFLTPLKQQQHQDGNGTKVKTLNTRFSVPNFTKIKRTLLPLKKIKQWRTKIKENITKMKKNEEKFQQKVLKTKTIKKNHSPRVPWHQKTTTALAFFEEIPSINVIDLDTQKSINLLPTFSNQDEMDKKELFVHRPNSNSLLIKNMQHDDYHHFFNEKIHKNQQKTVFLRAGGQIQDLEKNFMIELNHGKFTTLSDFSIKRNDSALHYHPKKGIFAFGGYKFETKFEGMNSIEVLSFIHHNNDNNNDYDDDEKVKEKKIKWEVLKHSMKEKRQGHSICTVGEHSLLIFGGEEPNHDNVEIFDFDDSKKNKLLKICSINQHYKSGIIRNNDQVYLVGGASDKISHQVACFNLKRQKFTKLPDTKKTHWVYPFVNVSCKVLTVIGNEVDIQKRTKNDWGYVERLDLREGKNFQVIQSVIDLMDLNKNQIEQAFFKHFS